MKRVRKGYDEFWAELWIHWAQNSEGPEELAENYRREAQFITKALRLSSGHRVLDLGCGAGGHCLALAAQGIEATGIEVAKVLVDLASKKAQESESPATFSLGDMRTFRTDIQFDAVFTSSGTFGMFESDSDNRCVLRSIYAALADGGRFLIGPSGPGLLQQRSYSQKDWHFVRDGCLLRERSWNQSTSLFFETFFFIDKEGTLIEFGGFDDASDGLYGRGIQPCL